MITEITGLAPSVRLRSLAGPLAGRRSIYERGRMGIGWGHKESGYGLGGRASGLGRAQAGGLWAAAGSNRANRASKGVSIVLAVATPPFGCTVFVVVLSVLGVEGLGGGLRVWSPAGGGTRLRAEMPCA